ncbi:MAG: response regulator, partial [bacterium]
MSKILIVDDEKQILSSLNRLLKDSFEVVTCDNFNAALSALGEQDIDVVISDYNLNAEMSGSDFLNVISQKWPYITRIILTGYSESSIAKDALNRASVFRFVTKPWDDESLLSVVAEAVKRSKIMKKNTDLLKEIEEPSEEITEKISELKAQMKEMGKEKKVKFKDKRYHLVLLAKSEEGVRNIFKIITEANLNGFYYKPRINIEYIIENKKDVIVLSACASSWVTNL